MPAGSRRYSLQSPLPRGQFVPLFLLISFPVKKFLALLLALGAGFFIFAADPVKPATTAKPKSDVKCDDGSCCDDDKPAAGKDAKAKAVESKADTAKKESAKPGEKK
jgi:hypothetical protein